MSAHGQDPADPPVESAPRCRCAQPFAELVAVIEGVGYAVRPADSLGPAQALYRAYCRRCRAEYPGCWRVADLPPPPVRTPPQPPVRQELLW